jgi:hypothetical protein
MGSKRKRKNPTINVAVGVATLSAPTTAVVAAVYRGLTDIPENHPLFSLIGRVAAEWTQLEHILDIIIWSLVGKHNSRVTACLTAQVQGAQAKCWAIQALLLEKGLPKSASTAVNTLLKDVHKPQNARNRIVHDPWFAEVGGSSIARHTKMARNEWVFGIEPVTESQITQTIKDIKELQAKALQLLQIVSALLTPSPKTDA